MSLRTLKFGDRTISYDAGLDSFGADHHHHHQPQSVVSQRRLSTTEVEHLSNSNRSGAVSPQEGDSESGGGKKDSVASG